MQTVAEYLIDPRRSWVAVGIPDGWRPLEVRLVEATGEIVLAALVDDEALPETEIVRLVEPGADIYAATEGHECAYLGFCAGRYLFLDLPEDAPVRRVSHPSLIEESLKNGVAPPDTGE